MYEGRTPSAGDNDNFDCRRRRAPPPFNFLNYVPSTDQQSLNDFIS